MRHVVILASALAALSAPALAQNFSRPAGDLAAEQAPIDSLTGRFGRPAPSHEGRSVGMRAPDIFYGRSEETDPRR